MGVRKTDPIPEPPTTIRDLWVEGAVRAMDESLESLCAKCRASFPVKDSALCAECSYEGTD